MSTMPPMNNHRLQRVGNLPSTPSLARRNLPKSSKSSSMALPSPQRSIHWLDISYGFVNQIPEQNQSSILNSKTSSKFYPVLSASTGLGSRQSTSRMVLSDSRTILESNVSCFMLVPTALVSIWSTQAMFSLRNHF